MISNNYYETMRESFGLLEKYMRLEGSYIRPSIKSRSSLDVIFAKIKRDGKLAMDLKTIIEKMSSIVQ